MAAGEEAQGMPPVSYPIYRDWRERAELFERGIAAHGLARFNVRLLGESSGEPAWGELVSGNFFTAAGVTPFLGRSVTDEDEQRRAPVAVVSERFGGGGSARTLTSWGRVFC